jgi:hypothetical protein
LIELPKVKIPASVHSPRRLLIYSKPKVGKTELISKLDNCLILDLEGGTDGIDALKINIESLDHLKAVCDQIIAEGKPYKYIAIDTVTKLEDMCLSLALKLYKDTPMGASFKGLNVLHLPNGAGYQYLRDAMALVIQKIEKCANRVIYLGHIKVKSIEKNGKEVMASDIDLTGKIRSSFSADSDAIGIMYREANKNIISFNTKDEVICGARFPHLKNAEFPISEMVDNNLITHWDKIYID